MPTLDDPLSPAALLNAELVRIVRAQAAAPSKAMLADVDLEDEAEEEAQAALCDHAWSLVSDWYGDPTLHNGTADCSYWRCLNCDDETSEPPQGWDERAARDEYEAAEAEYRRESREDR